MKNGVESIFDIGHVSGMSPASEITRVLRPRIDFYGQDGLEHHPNPLEAIFRGFGSHKNKGFRIKVRRTVPGPFFMEHSEEKDRQTEHIFVK